MYYCGPDAVVYLTTRNQYSQYYRDDRRHFKMESFYNEIGLTHEKKKMPVQQYAPGSADALDVYKQWAAKNLSDEASACKSKAADASPCCPHKEHKDESLPAFTQPPQIRS